jgi:hypothetical protein
MGMGQLPEVVSLGAFTPQTFLSGFYGQREPGLLEKLGETTERNRIYTTTGNGILLAKDFTTILSMRRDTQAEILAQLREIHDGEFRRTPDHHNIETPSPHVTQHLTCIRGVPTNDQTPLAEVTRTWAGLRIVVGIRIGVLVVTAISVPSLGDHRSNAESPRPR